MRKLTDFLNKFFFYFKHFKHISQTTNTNKRFYPKSMQQKKYNIKYEKNNTHINMKFFLYGHAEI